MRALFFATLLILLPASLCAAAAVTTDPGAYAYFAEEIELAIENAKKMEKQLTEMKAIKDGISDAADQMKGMYWKSIHTVRALNKVYDEAQNFQTTMDKTKAKLIRQAESVGGYSDSDKLIDYMYKDPRNKPASDPYEDAKQEAVQYEIRQQKALDIMNTSEKTLTDMHSRMGEIKELADKIPAAESLKDAQDITNGLLVEILYVLLQQLQLAANFVELESLREYRGMSDSGLEKHLEHIDSMKVQVAEMGYMDKALEEYGINPNREITSEDFRRALLQ